MFLISDSTTGYIAIGCLALIALICIVMAIVSSARKRSEKDDTNERNVQNETLTPAQDEHDESLDDSDDNNPKDNTEEEKEENVSEETPVTLEEENVEEEKEESEEEVEDETDESSDNSDDNNPKDNTEEEKEESVNEEEPTVEDEEVEEEKEESEEEVKEEPVEEDSKEDEEKTIENKKGSKTAKTTKATEVKSTSGRYAGKYIIMCENDQYRYQLFASNGQSLIISEGYTTEKGCRNGIQTVKKNITEGMVKIDSDKHDKYFFTLVSKQNRILCQSASYTTKESAVNASESFKKFALTDNIIFDENAKGVISSGEKADVEYEDKDNGKYEIREDSNGNGYIYVLKASNNVEIVTSQDYSTYASAKEALERFREAVYQGEFLIIKDKNNNYQFKLYNQSKRLVVAGEVYESKQQVLSTIVSIKSFAKLAQLDETTDKQED